ncbi:MAG: hypothetical protein KKD17_03470 [Nanoarchaeota archaeon]|nr:hypothetical protein [Nanoarchaeota archaeon]
MEDALGIRVNSAYSGVKDTYIPAKVVHKDRPPFSVELFKRRVCGTVTGVLSGRFRGQSVSLYELASDELLDPGESRFNRHNRRKYHVAGGPGLVQDDRIHAYVSRLRHPVVADDGKTVLAHLISWYDLIYNTAAGNHT